MEKSSRGSQSPASSDTEKADDGSRPRKRRRLSNDMVASHSPTVQQLLLEEIDLEVAIRQRIADTVRSRIAWALLLQQSLQRGTSFRLDDFRAASLEALDAIEAPCDLIYHREVRLAPQPIRPPPPAKATQPDSATSPLTSTSRSTRTRGLPRAAPAPRERLLFIRNTSTDPPEVAKLACPVCARSDFSSLQGLLNHCRLRHQIEYGSHDECMQSCAVIVPENERDWVAAAGIEVGGVSLPSLRRLFEIAVGAGDKVILPTRKPPPSVPAPVTAETDREQAPILADTKKEPSEDVAQERAHITKTLGYHIDTPALAPFLGRAPKKRCINVRVDEDEPVDIEDGSAGSGLQNRRIWRKPYAHRNIARKELDEVIPLSELPSNATPQQDANDTPQEASANHDAGRKDSPALQMLSGTRFHINARVQVADYSLFLAPNRRPAHYPDHTHRWRLVVNSPAYSLPITSILRELTVTCITDPPPSSATVPLTISEPPFVVTSTTDRPFLVRLSFTWAGSMNPPTEIEHWVELDPMHYSNPVLGDQQVFDVELDRSTELLTVPPDLNEVSLESMHSGETTNHAAPEEELGEEEAEAEPDYSIRLRSLVPQFPMTLKDVKGRFSSRLPYTLASGPTHLRTMCYGRRKALEMARARSLRDAYSQLVSQQHDADAVPLTAVDVFHWLEDEGFYPRSGVRAKQDLQKQGPAKSSRRQRGPGALANDAFCRTCGLHRAYHPNVVDEDVKPMDIKPAALGAAVERGLCMFFTGEDREPTRRPIFDVDALLKFAPANSDIGAAPEVPYGLSRAIFVAPSSSSQRTVMSSSPVDLVSVADPALVVAIQRITGLPRSRNEAAQRRSSEEIAAPHLLTTLTRSEAAVELAPSALLAVVLKGLVRQLVGRGIDTLRQDEAALRVATGRHERARRAPAAGETLSPRRVLAPSHVLRGVAGYARTGSAGSALRVCLARLGERCAVLDDDPTGGAIHIRAGQDGEGDRGDGDVSGEKDSALLPGPGLVLPDGMVVKAEER